MRIMSLLLMAFLIVSCSSSGVKRLSSGNMFRGKTKLSYKSYETVVKEAKEQAAKKMWTANKLSNRIAIAGKGGQLKLHIERSTIGAANFKYFTVVVEDSNGIEVMRKELDSDIPETPIRNTQWWNLTLIKIPNKIDYPFYVYVIDDLSNGGPIKFEVTGN